MLPCCSPTGFLPPLLLAKVLPPSVCWKILRIVSPLHCYSIIIRMLFIHPGLLIKVSLNSCCRAPSPVFRLRIDSARVSLSSVLLPVTITLHAASAHPYCLISFSPGEVSYATKNRRTLRLDQVSLTWSGINTLRILQAQILQALLSPGEISPGSYALPSRR